MPARRSEAMMEGSVARVARTSLLKRYEELIGVRATERLLRKARALAGMKVLHVNSTREGGGVAEILASFAPLMNDVGIRTDWSVITGPPEFFGVTKHIHNALHGEHVGFTRDGIELHREVALSSILGAQLDNYDVVIVHDPQPLHLVEKRGRKQLWIWWCHIDLSAPDEHVWAYLAPTIGRYDVAVFSLPEYAQPLDIQQRFIMPAIDPFSATNRDMSRLESLNELRRYQIPLNLPLVVQVGRFDKWKDPQGVIDAFCAAASQAPARLILAGNTAADDPEGPGMYEAISSCASECIRVIAADDRLLVNALQRRAAVVLQKSLREGFGLTVSEAMWKGRPVIGGSVGGIRHQIVQDETGFLVADVDQAAAHIVALLQDAELRRRMGRRARERVRRHFLLTRLLEDWLDLIADLTRVERGGPEARRAAAAAWR
jgi:trehalose synthase